ncbi:MAG: dihydropteroate synthase [Pseudomonadota bacterium]
MTRLIRPILSADRARPADALTLAEGWCWFTHVEVLDQGIQPASELTDTERARLTAPRAPIAGLAWDAPRVMAILNVTPDSFSDGGLYASQNDASEHARELQHAGADLIDIGGESTRPGADAVPSEQEIARTGPVIADLAPQLSRPISIDTRKADVAEYALQTGAALINDVSAGTHDPAMLSTAARLDAPICLMHAQGDPKTMQATPKYRDVVAEVYAHLEERIAACAAAGIPRARIVIDPGIGFGKTLAHNLELLSKIAVFHSLGCVVLVGASRKRFIGTISGTADAAERLPGSLAVALAAAEQGIQILRVHDMAETRQAFHLAQAMREGQYDAT